MSRTVAGDTQAQLTSQSVRPFHIAEIEFGTGTVYLSEGKEITFNSNNFLDGTLTVGDIGWDNAGMQVGRISLADYDGSTLALMLTNQIADTPINLWLTYGTAGTGFTTPILVAKGTLNPISITEDEIVLEITPVNINTEFFPRRYCTKGEGFNYLPKSGTVVEWGEEKFELVND
jgi:hypothetical protein